MLSEHDHQVIFFRWLDLMSVKYPDCGKAFAIPTGGHRHIAVAAKMKAEGVKKGIPDIFLPVAKHGYNGLFIELKKDNRSWVTNEQKERITQLRTDGYVAEVARGWQAAAKKVVDYLELPEELKE